MSDFKPGLEGVVAFESEIAEPDKEGGALRYRGVNIEELVGHVSYGSVWGLLVDNAFEPGLPPAEPYPIPVHSGDIRVDVQSALAMLAPAWGMQPLLDISDSQAREDLARASVMALSFVAQAARGVGLPMVPQNRVDEAVTITERFMIRWRGEPDPKHVRAIDAYWTSAAEHGMNASTFTARVIASTGADVAAALSGAVGAMSGPLHGGAPARVLHMIEEVERTGNAEAYVKQALDSGQATEDGTATVDGQPTIKLTFPAVHGWTSTLYADSQTYEPVQSLSVAPANAQDPSAGTDTVTENWLPATAANIANAQLAQIPAGFTQVSQTTLEKENPAGR